MTEKKHDECNCEHDHEHNHECDCGCEHDECDCGCEDEVVVLQDENGKDVAFHYVYNMEHEGKEYVFLQEVDGEEEILIFQLTTVQEDGEYFDQLDPVDDDLYDILYEKLLLVASEDACEEDGCDCHDEHCDCHNH